MHIASPYAHFPFAEDNITTSIAEDSIATSGGVKVSQSRMSFALQSTGALPAVAAEFTDPRPPTPSPSRSNNTKVDVLGIMEFEVLWGFRWEFQLH
jgi:hypothetical protein